MIMILSINRESLCWNCGVSQGRGTCYTIEKTEDGKHQDIREHCDLISFCSSTFDKIVVTILYI